MSNVETEKLQKVLARAGVGSRREMEKYIDANRVSVNGKVARLGDRVEATDVIRVDGHVVKIEDKETTLRAISRSAAGKNWLNMMILNLYEAMLSPPAYGGNPDGIGWQWINHQPGFPLPQAGKRYYELPTRSSNPIKVVQIIENTDLTAKSSTPSIKKLSQGKTKA